MTRDYTYRLKKIPMEEDTPIFIGSHGGLLTDVITPKAYIDFKIDEKIKKLDDRMVKYLDRYRRERKKLREQRHETHEKFKGVNRFDIIHGFTPEEREEYQRLFKESMEKFRLNQGLVQQ